jgi:hypothetical protein
MEWRSISIGKLGQLVCFKPMKTGHEKVKKPVGRKRSLELRSGLGRVRCKSNAVLLSAFTNKV